MTTTSILSARIGVLEREIGDLRAKVESLEKVIARLAARTSPVGRTPPVETNPYRPVKFLPEWPHIPTGDRNDRT